MHPELINATDTSGETPLHWVFRRTDATAISLMLRHGAEPDTREHANQTPLFLMDVGAEIYACDDEGYSAVMMAVLANSTECVQILICKEARLNFIALDEESVLDLAACCAGAAVMRLLAAAEMRGLPMAESDVAGYRAKFETMRDCDFVGEREAAEEERAAFDALLASVRPRSEGGYGQGGCSPQEVPAGDPGLILMLGMWPDGD